MKKYTEDHEWVLVDGDTATVGITSHAAGQLGDVVFVELPAVGAKFAQKSEMAVVESVKAASDVYAPVSGEVVAVNQAVAEDPARVNADPEGGSWFVKIRLSNKGELEKLLDESSYRKLVG